MDFTLTFAQIFFWGIFFTAPIILLMFCLIILLGLIVGRMESWSRFDSIYWSMITALTVGYGDIRPLHRGSRIISIIIGFIGIMLAGILVAITVEATTVAFERHTDPALLQAVEKTIR